MKWDLEPERKDSIKALKELKNAIEKGYSKPCKMKGTGCPTCLAWGIYDLVKLILH